MKESLEFSDKHWATLVKITTDLQTPNETERKILENLIVRRAVSDLLIIFSTVAIAINRLQASAATIGKAVEVWINLMENVCEHYRFIPLDD